MTDVEAGAVDDTQDAPGGETAEGASEAQAAQDVLTQSVGQRLTRESHDAQRSGWRRWLGKG
jgi:hypothetical protein